MKKQHLANRSTEYRVTARSRLVTSLFFSLIIFQLSGIAAGTKLVFKNTSFHAGIVPRRQKLAHTFSFRIEGDDSLQIERASSPCGCEVISFPKETKNGGDTGSVTVEYTSGMVEGPFEKEISLFTGKGPAGTKLRITGEVRKLIEVDPPTIDLSRFQLGSRDTVSLKITWKRWEEVGLSKNFGVGPITSVSVGKDPEDGNIWRVGLLLDKGAEAKYYSDTLIIATASDQWPEIKIPIQGTVQGIVTLKPQVLNLGTLQAGKIVSGSFLAISSSDIDSVVSANTQGWGIIVKRVKKIDTKRLRIFIQTAAAGKTGSLQAEVILRVMNRGKLSEARAVVSGRFVE
jgi:hypothetical protein